LRVALTEAADKLTDRHMREQLAIRSQALDEFASIMAHFDPKNSYSVAATRNALVSTTTEYRVKSAEAASRYYAAFRSAEGVPGIAPLPTIDVADDAFREVIGDSYRFLLRKDAFALGSAIEEAGLLRRTEAELAARLSRYVLEGGRLRLSDLIRADRAAVGWVRVTRGKACAFCGLLAARGPVYSKRTGGFRAHNRCACTIEPVFHDLPREKWPPSSRAWADKYAEWKQASATGEVGSWRSFAG
jgi:hypothetical protein